MALVGINPSRQNRWFRRVAVGPVGSTAAQAYLHLKPMAEPTDITAVEGDMYFNSTNNGLAFHDGTNWKYAIGSLSQTQDVLYGYKKNVLASSGNTTMTSAMTGSVMLVDGASTDYTLPAIGTGDVGMHFEFVATIISTGTQTITAGAADLLTGQALIVNVAATGTDGFAPDVTDDLIHTWNGTTMGGVAVGAYARYIAISATRWYVNALSAGSGTLVNPFS